MFHTKKLMLSREECHQIPAMNAVTTEETAKEIIVGKFTISTKKEQLSNTRKARRRTLSKNVFAIFSLTIKTRVPVFAHMSLFHYGENISTTVIFLRRYHYN